MRIGVDISQLAYPETGVSNYLFNLIRELIENDKNNEYILFFSSLRRDLPRDTKDAIAANSNATIKKVKIPLSALSFLWNNLHIFPIENFIGKIDLFVTSDWLEPPTRAKKATIIYDLIILKHPDETAQKIVSTQKQKLKWVKKESNIVFCISESTKKDVTELLGVNNKKINVIYPGI